MPGRPRKRTAFIGTATLIALIVAAAIFAPPYVVRYVVVSYLKSHGLTSVHIKNVNANLFTGHIGIDGASGHNANGRGFSIGHLGLNVSYPPLFHHRIVLDALNIRGARLDVTRAAHNKLQFAGLSFSQSKQSSSSSSAWRYGLEQLTLGALTIHYHQPAGPQRAAVDRIITLNDSKASHIITWNAGQSVPLDAKIGVDGGSIQLTGHVTPFGDHRAASVHVVIHDFPVSLVAPLARRAGVTKGSGQINADLHIQATDPSHQALQASVKGHLAFVNLLLNRYGDVHAEAKKIAWHGSATMTLMRPNHQLGEIRTDGAFSLAGLVMRKGSDFQLKADKANWQGKGEITFDKPLRISTHGKYDDNNVRLVAKNQLKLSTDGENLTGDIEATIGNQQSTVASDGQYVADNLSVDVPKTLSIDTDQVNWHGTTQTTLTPDATRIDMNGKLHSQTMKLAIVDTAQLSAQSVTWQGETHVDKGKLDVRHATGHLTAIQPRLELPGQPIALQGENFVFDGHYGDIPDESGKALKTVVNGDASSREFKAMDTRIHAPWFAAMQTQASGIRVDGLSDIQLAQLQSSGVRMLGDTNTDASVIQAVSLNVKQFGLTDLRHYSSAAIKIDNAIVHVRRDKQGMGVISQFLGASGQSKSSTASGTRTTAEHASRANSSSSASNTYAVKHFAIAGPAVYFTDTSTQPNVNLHGSNLNFVVDGLDTGHPNQNANYRLSLDLGAYGHLDSKGAIAPLAPHGMNANLHAWLRSLAMPPLSGYLNAAMGRKIARGVIDGTLDLKADKGQLNGTLSATISNFRLANDDGKTTEIALGINMETALAMIRGEDDAFHFQTKILGDVTNPYFSIDNLIREAILAGLRTALMSNYSPIGLLAKAKTAFLNLFRSVEGRPAKFEPGKHYVRPADRHYLVLIAQAMDKHPSWALSLTGEATPADAKAMSLLSSGSYLDSSNRLKLKELARERAQAIRDYLAARGVNTANLIVKPPVVDEGKDAQPVVRFKLDKKDDD